MYKLICITTCVKTYFLPSLHRQYYYSDIMRVDYVSTWRFTLFRRGQTLIENCAEKLARDYNLDIDRR